MTSRYVLIYSKNGLAPARQEIAKAKSAGIDLPAHELAMEATRPARDTQSAPRYVVGIWSLEAWLADLSGLVGALNRAQDTFVFYEVDAAVPAGLISRPERVAAWYKRATGRKPRKRVWENLKDNLIAEDFFDLAEEIRTDLTLDYIIGVTPSMVAGTDPSEVYWNHFSTFSGHTVLTSSYQLHEFARETGWPLNAFLAKIIVSQLLVAVMYPKLNFHDDTGCLFDYDGSRASLKDKVSNPHIEPGCLKKIKPAYRPVALAFVDLLRSYGGAK